jgi:hypothetical protein
MGQEQLKNIQQESFSDKPYVTVYIVYNWYTPGIYQVYTNHVSWSTLMAFCFTISVGGLQRISFNLSYTTSRPFLDMVYDSLKPILDRYETDPFVTNQVYSRYIPDLSIPVISWYTPSIYLVYQIYALIYTRYKPGIYQVYIPFSMEYIWYLPSIYPDYARYG